MKILHIIDEMGMGGAQSLLVELAPVQKEMGNDVLILELQAMPDRTLVKKLENKGISVETISHKRSVRNPLNVFSIIPYLRKFDIIHVHLFPANYWTVFAKIISFCKTPIVTTEHSTDNKRRKYLFFKYIDTFIYQSYQKVIACSDKALETFKRRFSGVKCISIPNGVDISKYLNAEPYSKRDLLGIDEDNFIITMVARFKYPKRQDTVVEAIAQLPSKFNCVLVGGEPGDIEVQKIEKLAKKRGVIDRIHFLYVRSDVPRILKSSDVVLMASEYEGLSLSSIEGMACGHPFIATNVNGLREVVEGAGELFECGNTQQLAELLLKFSSEKDFYNKITSKCLARAKEYDIHVVAEKYQKLYENILLK